MKMTVNPEVFVDLFLFCLWWQTKDAERDSHRWTTVDSVVKTLVELELISEAVKKGIRKNFDLQNLMRRNTDVRSLVAEFQPVYDAATRPFLYRGSDHLEVDRSRLLRDYRVFITSAGMRKAAVVEAKYSSFLSGQVYLEKRAEIEARFEEVSEGALAAVAARYREKCKTDRD